MKILLIGINTKYIHPNMAIRLLKKNCDFDVDLKEFTIKDSNDKIIDFIKNNEIKYDLISFSCYIWNIEKVLELTKLIKEFNNSVKILLGGPEISFEYQDIIKDESIDFIIKDEGEITFNQLLYALINNKDYSKIDNLVTKNFDNPVKKFGLCNIKSAYDVDLDYKNQIIYFESNRGCPFNCSYCLSSTYNKVRFFEIDKIKNDLLFLLQNGAKTIKFLDRNFTTNKKYALEIIKFLNENKTEGCSFQFEINLDILSEEFLTEIENMIEPGIFRFEVGIQTLNYDSNLLVNRHQNNELLLKNLVRLNKNNIIDIHADLIFGLPEDNINSFRDTFNRVLQTKPKELQLGFLKFLKGTKVRNEYKKYGYEFDPKAPYEIIKSNTVSIDDLKYTKIVENALDHYYNKGIMPLTMNYITNKIDNLFDFFYDLGVYFNNKFDKSNKQFDTYFTIFIEFISKFDYFNEIYPLILLDYYNHFNIKPKTIGETFDKKEKNKILVSLFENNFINELPLDDYYKYCNLVKINNNEALFYYYSNNSKLIKIINL